MRDVLLRLLACPHCHGDLRPGQVSAARGDELLEGELVCSGCSRRFDVLAGIPRFVPVADDTSFGLQWNRFRREQLDSFSGLPLSANRFWSETQWDPGWLRGKLVLDAGCGAGRFLEIAAQTGAEVVGVDISSAVDAAAISVGWRRNVHLVQADIFNLPFKQATFDACYSIGVLQHTPNPGRALGGLPTVVRDGGRVAVTVYERRRWTRLYGKYLLRPFTRRMAPTQLMRLLTLAMPLLFPLTELLFRIPLAGRLFRFVIPVANYVDVHELPRRTRYRWALMDTFDMLAPSDDHPQQESTLRRVLKQSGVEEVVRTAGPGLALSGVVHRPPPAAPTASSPS